MKGYIELERRRNSLKPYRTAAIIITACLFGMLYLFLLIPKLDPSAFGSAAPVSAMPQGMDDAYFMSLEGLGNLLGILGMVCFSILGAVMYSKFVVEEYFGKRVYLLFSYPVDRKQIFLAKILLVSAYTVCAMLLCGFVIFSIFFIAEGFFPLLIEPLTAGTVVNTALVWLCYSIMAGAMGSVSLWFGFWKKTAVSTVVASVLISLLATQVMQLTMYATAAGLVLMAVGVLLAVCSLRALAGKVNRMEA